VAANIQTAFDEAAWHEPSVVLLDDLDQIVTACSGPDQEMSGEALYHAKLAKSRLSFVHGLRVLSFEKAKAHVYFNTFSGIQFVNILEPTFSKYCDTTLI